MTAPGCPACGSTGTLKPLVEIEPQPVLCGALCSSREEARSVTRGPMSLASCSDCGLVTNVAFDPSLVVYDRSYENSLHFSPTFQHYAEELAEWLIETHHVQGKRVLEIGSGKGEFLTLLCARGKNVGVGYDPSYEGESDSPRVRFERRMYPLDGSGEAFDFLCCRHVLEHLSNPGALLEGLHARARSSGASLYIEVPNGADTLTSCGMWDLIYPHVSYFSETALRRLVVKSGFEAVTSGTSFGGQFLSLVARSSTQSAVPQVPHHDEEMSLAVSEFAHVYATVTSQWRKRLSDLHAEGRRSAVWGAGAKGATFVNTVGAEAVDVVVDVNPRKWGSYLPGSGHGVEAPEKLRGLAVSTIVVMNRRYEAEIADHVRRLGLDVELVSV